MFKSLFDLGKNVVDVVTAPVEIAADLANATVVKPLKEMTDEIKADIKEELDD